MYVDLIWSPLYIIYSSYIPTSCCYEAATINICIWCVVQNANVGKQFLLISSICTSFFLSPHLLTGNKIELQSQLYYEWLEVVIIKSTANNNGWASGRGWRSPREAWATAAAARRRQLRMRRAGEKYRMNRRGRVPSVKFSYVRQPACQPSDH